MLSKEQRSQVDTYSHKGGMRNLVYATGIVAELDARGGKLLQSRYANLALPFRLRDADSMPRWLKRGNPVKVVGRFEASRHPDTGEPTGIIRVLQFDVPKVIDLPPEAAWEVSVRRGVAQSDISPSVGQTGVGQNPNANLAWVAGFVAGARLRRAGSPTPNGPAGSDCLYILLQQSEDPTAAIPVRLYGRLSALNERAIRIGSPIQVRDGAVRVDAKPTGAVDADGLEQTHNYLYVKARSLHTATREDISEIPAWAREMAEQANELRRRKAEEAQERRERAVSPSASAGAQSGVSAPAAGGRRDGEVDAAEVANFLGIAATPAQ